MRRGVACWTGVLLMIPEIAVAGAARLGGEVKVGYDSNVLGGGGKRGSAQVQLRARGSVEDQLERGSYSLHYAPIYFINTAGAANLWNHRAAAEGTYHFSPRTNLRVHDDFSYIEKNVYAPNDPDPNANVEDNTKKTILNTVGLTGSHLLTRRLSAYGGSEFTIYRFSRRQDEDNDLYGGFAGLNFALSPTITVGGGTQASYRIFEARKNDSTDCSGENGPQGRSVSYAGYVSGSYRYSEDTGFSVRAGPARIETTNWFCNNQTSPNHFVRQDTSQTTWFAQADASHRFARFLDGVLSYRRSQGLGGVGTTTVNDVVIGRANWQPARFWKLGLRASWIHRSQVSARDPVTQTKQTTNTDTYTVAGSVSRQVLRRLRVGVDASYRRQDKHSKFSNPSNSSQVPVDTGVRSFDDYAVFGTVIYEFDPIPY